MERKSNIEILRILAMLLVVLSHVSYHGVNDLIGGYKNISNHFNESLLRCLLTGNLGNVIFMMITGYFLCESKNVKLDKLLKVVVQVLTYSILCYLTSVCVGINTISVKNIFVAITPLSHSTYWYFSAYVLVYLLHPYLNMVINSSTDKGFVYLLIIMIVVWGFLPDILNLKFGRSYFLIFCLFYFMGAFVKRYYILERGFRIRNKYYLGRKQARRCFLICLSIWLLIAIIPIVNKGSGSYEIVYKCYTMGSPLTILLAVSIFVLFLHLLYQYKSHRINRLAGLMGGGIFVT